VRGIKCTFQLDFQGAAHRPPTTARSSMSEPSIAHVTLCLMGASRYKKYTGTFRKIIKLKYFPSYVIFIFITKFNFLLNNNNNNNNNNNKIKLNAYFFLLEEYSFLVRIYNCNVATYYNII